ncbi:conserved hypothetical protein [Ricinus communis]|uniref:Uncharacterized protein n=1 Tax=Ricinus communis TaxID=3988 RepID=B9SXB3_RICCO|nr:conserved hypothetical protein [Ricinus communis]
MDMEKNFRGVGIVGETLPLPQCRFSDGRHVHHTEGNEGGAGACGGRHGGDLVLMVAIIVYGGDGGCHGRV